MIPAMMIKVATMIAHVFFQFGKLHEFTPTP